MHRRIVTHRADAIEPSAGSDASARLDERPVAVVATTSSPWGPVHVAVSDRGVVAVAWASPVETVIADLERRLHGRVEEARPEGDDARTALLGRAIAEIQEWLAGRPTTFDLPLDLADRPEWDRAVLSAVRATPWGSVTSYGAIARLIGKPGAARAVGGAVGRNPIGVIVPCHRVIAGDGSIGGYGSDAWGTRGSRLELKRALLALEGVVVDRSSR